MGPRASTTRAAPAWPAGPRGLRGFLRRPGALEQFFRQHFRRFVTDAHEFVRADVRFPEAFSPSSVLTHVAVTVRSARTQTTVRLRGNRVSPESIRVLRTLCRAGTLRVPCPRWYYARAGYFFYEELSGNRLRDVNFRRARIKQIMAAVGTTLGSLHRVPAAGLPRLSWHQERLALAALRRHLAQARFQQGPALHSALRHLHAWEQRWWQRLPQVVCHNDFQGSNILVGQNGNISLIDFSRSGRGPLPIDAGQFIGHLTVMLAPRVSSAAIGRLRTVFLGAYRRRLPAPWRRIFDASLPGFELRIALEILGVSSLFLKGKRRDRILAPLLTHLPPLPRL